MADETDDTTAAAPEPRRFSYDEALSLSREAFAVAPHVMAGALHGGQGPWQRSTIERRIHEFLNRKVEVNE